MRGERREGEGHGHLVGVVGEGVEQDRDEEVHDEVVADEDGEDEVARADAPAGRVHVLGHRREEGASHQVEDGEHRRHEVVEVEARLGLEQRVVEELRDVRVVAARRVVDAAEELRRERGGGGRRHEM